MPSNLFFADSNFPTLTEGQKDSEKIKVIMNYLYQLLEQLRYTMANLGEGNFNETELDNIREPIYAKISDVEGNLTQLSITAEGIESTVSNLSGEFSAVKQDVDGLSIQTSGGTTYITGDHVRTGTLEGINLSSEDPSSNNNVSIVDGTVALGNGIFVHGYFQYDDDNDRLWLRSASGTGLKIEANSNMSIDAMSNIYIGTSYDDQVIYLGGSGKGNTVRLYGDIYINGTALDTYIHDVMGV